MFLAEDPRVPGVKRLSNRDGFPRPWVGVLAALHGDEPCGLIAHRHILEQAQAGTFGLSAGTLVLIEANQAAAKLERRHTPTGDDLNRICDLAFEESLAPERWGYEHHRAIELAPVLDGLDAALDLHSASAPTVPFAVAMPGALEIAKALGVRWVTHGWDEASDIAEGVAIARVARLGRPAAAVECGQHRDPSAADVALKVIARFLAHLGLWNQHVDAGETARVLRVFASLPKPSHEFRFAQPIQGFEPVREGQLLGRGEDDLRCPASGIAVLPNDRVPQGKNLVYLAREEDEGAR
ncbi:MAG: succinylglutamate desuccinylase/aspartoacylase family protein [Myxococcota bacterium]